VNIVKRILSALRRLPEPERGFGMIEVVISIFLLAMLALAFMPILINTIKDTARTTTIATATQLAGQQIEAARSVRSSTGSTPTCADIEQFLAVTPASVVDPRGVTLQPTWTVPTACPATIPPTVPPTVPAVVQAGVVRAEIKVMQGGNVVATAVTSIFYGSPGT
jgi:Tfp pilus assembly protein PilV